MSNFHKFSILIYFLLEKSLKIHNTYVTIKAIQKEFIYFSLQTTFTFLLKVIFQIITCKKVHILSKVTVN